VFIETATNGIISHSEARRGGECKMANIFGLRPSAASHKKSTPIFAGAIVTIPLLVSKVVFFRGVLEGNKCGATFRWRTVPSALI
jgi:hypothetical protein